jgi:hypothetical protein
MTAAAAATFAILHNYVPPRLISGLSFNVSGVYTVPEPGSFFMIQSAKNSNRRLFVSGTATLSGLTAPFRGRRLRAEGKSTGESVEIYTRLGQPGNAVAHSRCQVANRFIGQFLWGPARVSQVPIREKRKRVWKTLVSPPHERRLPTEEELAIGFGTDNPIDEWDPNTDGLVRQYKEPDGD